MTAFIRLPTGSDGRDTVAINVDEIASYREHTVVSYSYQQWTKVTLKSGVEHDCGISLAEFERRVAQARLQLEDS